MVRHLADLLGVQGFIPPSFHLIHAFRQTLDPEKIIAKLLNDLHFTITNHLAFIYQRFLKADSVCEEWKPGRAMAERKSVHLHKHPIQDHHQAHERFIIIRDRAGC